MHSNKGDRDKVEAGEIVAAGSLKNVKTGILMINRIRLYRIYGFS